ncbi:13649_t:CDS:2 [Dentiscutata erythropus]|uniref:13649_t:CDS:1 n=1 Tax=Dentiscutata erythropus TaxID=1348616 RepID=A0A9N8Z4M3_9GLOM|nr:13649_t:CDS:2 [Dentiscutata erythropus]
MTEFCCCWWHSYSAWYNTPRWIMFGRFVAIGAAVGYLGKPEAYAPDMSKGLTLVFGIAYIIMALVSFFGIIGSLFSAAGAVRIFATMLWGFVLVNLVIAIINIISLTTNKQTAIDRCIYNGQLQANSTISNINQSQSGTPVVSNITDGATSAAYGKVSGNLPDVCSNIETWRIIIFGIAVGIIILFQAYFARVASRFAEQLEAEFYRKHHHKLEDHSSRNGNNSTTGTDPYSHHK